MYIWILLATIMVALSFLNTSPREDKASVFTEIKAATVANRFRAEHIAFLRSTECQMLYRASSGEYDKPVIIDPDFKDEYTSFKDNLPVGYDMADNIADITHTIYCFDKDINAHSYDENTGKTYYDNPRLAGCGNSDYKYAISFAQIPDRWLSKEKMKIKYVQEDGSEVDEEIVTPLPNFINYLSKELSGVKNMGWMWCGHSGCHLVGRSSLQSKYYKKSNTKNSQLKYLQFTFPDAFDDPTWDPSVLFWQYCRAGVPCLFAFDRYKNSDTGLHCKAMKANKSI